MGLIKEVTSDECVARKAMELLDECRYEPYPHRAAWIEALNASSDPSTRRLRSKVLHYRAVMAWMENNWMELKQW